MRQLAVFETQDQADRLAAYLVTLRIAAHAEEENGAYSVWVRDENQMATARESLDHFRENPGDPRYRGVETAAEALRRKQEAERAARQKNVVEMRGRWKSGPGGMRRTTPVTIGLIIVSALVTIATDQIFESKKPPNAILESVRFVRSTEERNNFADIARGQVWRLVTPVFLHYGLLHLLFNMWVMYVLGGQIEDRRGPARYLLLLLLAAVISCTAQALVDQWQNRLALFGGMSGVGYGVFGYLWMKVKFDPAAGFHLEKLTVIILMTWLVLCILRDYSPFDTMLKGLLPHGVANTAHVVGLLVGMVAGYAPLLVKRR
jgi:GlpG protein